MRSASIAIFFAACTPTASTLPVPNLVLVDDPIRVSAPLGETVAVSVRLLNTGTAQAQVQLTTEAPVSAPAGFVVPANDARDVRLSVRPDTLGDVTVPLVLQTDFQTLRSEVRVVVDVDVDRDGFPSRAAGGTDCDDARASVFPGATEVCNELDDDCDGQVDVAAVDALTWHADADQDSWGVNSDGVVQCRQPAGFVARSGDCNDADPRIHPGRAEAYYDGVDADCDGQSDFDADGDGFDSVGWSGTDCRDSDPTAYPGAIERLADGIDQDCDGFADERPPTVGELAVTEVNPSPAAGPGYVELTSRTDAPLALDQMPIVAGGANVLPASFTLAGWDVLVVCDREGPVCDVVLDAMDLTPAAELRVGVPTLDTVPLVSLPWSEGVAADWPEPADPDDNDVAAMWCANTQGSPGVVPGTCDAD